MTCLATGCTFLDPRYPRAVYGDLHLVGDALVFNAVLADGEAAWNYEPRVLSTSRYFEFHPGPTGVDYFERRGVLVFPKDAARFSEALATYVQGAD